MSIRRAETIPFPIDEVFAWFARPGAFERLSPPWAPLRLVSEAQSLADGTAVLALPGGLRWEARHLRDEYVEGRRFVDEVAAGDDWRTWPTGVFPWRHTHTFEPVGDASTRVGDVVETPAPERLLAGQFAYRYRQLVADLEAHRRAADAGCSRATVAVTGGSGLVGTALSAFLRTGGHRVVSLVRREPESPDQRRWNPDDPMPADLSGVDAVIHLAGESIAGRFTDDHKAAIAGSRVGPTRLLADCAAEAGVGAFVSASAVGFYGADRGEDVLAEDDPGPAEADFLSGVVTEWEAAASAAGGDMRVVSVRTGIVQSPRGGTMRLMLPLFRAGLGGRLGDGRQWFPWIGIDDLIDVYHRALWDRTLSGPVNAVAPGIVRNSEYTRALGRVLHRPTILPVPGFGPELLLGREGARELALANQRVRPAKLLERDHVFRTGGIDDALRHLLGREA